MAYADPEEKKEKDREWFKEKSKFYYLNVIKDRIKANPDFYKEKDKLRNKKKYQLRKQTLTKLRLELGGKCYQCNYDEEVRILQFHHHKGGKDGDVSSIQSIKKMILEAKKCILLCPNCHAKTHLR